MQLFLMWYMEVRHSLIYYLLLFIVSGKLILTDINLTVSMHNDHQKHQIEFHVNISGHMVVNILFHKIVFTVKITVIHHMCL